MRTSHLPKLAETPIKNPELFFRMRYNALRERSSADSSLGSALAPTGDRLAKQKRKMQWLIILTHAEGGKFGMGTKKIFSTPLSLLLYNSFCTPVYHPLLLFSILLTKARGLPMGARSTNGHFKLLVVSPWVLAAPMRTPVYSLSDCPTAHK
jgi:hypothetical protein